MVADPRRRLGEIVMAEDTFARCPSHRPPASRVVKQAAYRCRERGRIAHGYEQAGLVVGNNRRHPAGTPGDHGKA
jgi:hypothetical protein